MKIKAKENKKILTYRLCTSCGNFMNINETAEFCIICGKKLIFECPRCNSEILYPTAKHCHNCGSEYKKS